MWELLTQEIFANIASTTTECKKEYDYIVRGSIIPSCATWFKQGERDNKYFFNLENRNKKTSCTRKLTRTNGEETTFPDTIMSQIHILFWTLWQKVKLTIQLVPFCKISFHPLS